MIGGVAPAPHLFCFASAGNGETPHPSYTTNSAGVSPYESPQELHTCRAGRGPWPVTSHRKETRMATLTTTPPLASDSPGMLPADRTLEPACGWFVLGTWLFLTVVALGFVTLYGNRTPRWEDWFFVPFVMVAQRVDLAWLWENAQGHRVRIAKLVLCACYSLFGFNSKPILYLNVLLFSALSLGLLWAIRRVRGRWCYTDALLPILLLNLGQAEAFSWAQTFAYLSATCLETILLIFIATHREGLN